MDTYDARIESILGYTSSLESYAECLLFPPISKDPDAPLIHMTGKSWILFITANPVTGIFSGLLNESEKHKDRKLVASIGFFFIGLILSTIAGWPLIKDLVEYGFGFFQINIPNNPLWIIFTVFYLYWIAAQYWYWYRFLSENTRFIFKILAPILLLFWSSYLFISDSTFFDKLNLASVLQDISTHLSQFALAFVLLIFPTLSFLFWFTIRSIIIFGYLSIIGLRNLFLVSTELPMKRVGELATAEIPFKNDPDKKWQVNDLTEQEIKLITNWATSRADAISRRLIPPTIVFGFLALFINTDTVKGILESAAKPIVNFFARESSGLGDAIGVTLTLFVIAIIGGISWENWKASAVLNLIQEAFSLVDKQKNVNSLKIKQNEKNNLEAANSFGFLVFIFFIIGVIWNYINKFVKNRG